MEKTNLKCPQCRKETSQNPCEHCGYQFPKREAYLRKSIKKICNLNVDLLNSLPATKNNFEVENHQAFQRIIRCSLAKADSENISMEDLEKAFKDLCHLTIQFMDTFPFFLIFKEITSAIVSLNSDL